MPTVTKQNRVRAKPKVSGVIGRIAPISLPESGLRMLIYGLSGSGKTTIACTFPKPLLLIGAGASAADADGTRSVHNVNGVSFVMINDSGELTELTPYAGENFKTVVLDHATSLEDMILKEILGIDELPAQKSWGMASREQYGQRSLQTKERLRALLGLTNQTDIVILSQERNFNEDTTSEILLPYVGAGLSPATTNWLNTACDYIVHAYKQQRVETKTVKINGKPQTTEYKVKGKVDYCLRVGPDPTYQTKFRMPKGTELPLFIKDPSYASIMKLIQVGE